MEYAPSCIPDRRARIRPPLQSFLLAPPNCIARHARSGSQECETANCTTTRALEPSLCGRDAVYHLLQILHAISYRASNRPSDATTAAALPRVPRESSSDAARWPGPARVGGRFRVRGPPTDRSLSRLGRAPGDSLCLFTRIKTPPATSAQSVVRAALARRILAPKLPAY